MSISVIICEPLTNASEALQIGRRRPKSHILMREFHLYTGNYELGTAQDRYCWQISVKARRDRTSRFQLLDGTTSTRDHTSATTAAGSPSHVVTAPASPVEAVSISELRLRTLAYATWTLHGCFDASSWMLSTTSTSSSSAGEGVRTR